MYELKSEIKHREANVSDEGLCDQNGAWNK